MTRKEMREALQKWSQGVPDVSALHDRLKEYDRIEQDLLCAPNSPRYDSMPRSGALSDPTANTALGMDRTRRELQREYAYARAKIWQQIKSAFDAYERINDAVYALPCQLQGVVKMLYLEKLTLAQAADRLRYSAKHVDRREREAVDMLIEGMGGGLT